MKEPSLHDVLKARGYTHRPALNCGNTSAHDILDADGIEVFSGSAHEVWEWLRDEKETR